MAKLNLGLSGGYAAGKGADRLFEMIKQREVERQALEDEEIRRQQLNESFLLRQQGQQSLDEERKSRAQEREERTYDRGEATYLKKRELMAPGTDVTPEEYAEGEKYGLGPTFEKFAEETLPPDQEGPVRPGSIKTKPTATQLKNQQMDEYRDRYGDIMEKYRNGLIDQAETKLALANLQLQINQAAENRQLRESQFRMSPKEQSEVEYAKARARLEASREMGGGVALNDVQEAAMKAEIQEIAYNTELDEDGKRKAIDALVTKYEQKGRGNAPRHEGSPQRPGPRTPADPAGASQTPANVDPLGIFFQ